MPVIIDVWEELGLKLIKTKDGGVYLNYSDCYPTIHPDDRDPVSVIAPDLDQGPWIAGGAVLRWFQGKAVGSSDIDIFCCDADQAQQVVDKIKSTDCYTVKHHSENAFTLGYNKGDWSKNWTLQVITKKYYKHIKEVIESFDITVCQIATTGNEWILNADTAKDIRTKTLRFSGELQPDAMKRLVKYWTYGYRPSPETVKLVQDNPKANWKFASYDEYQNAF